MEKDLWQHEVHGELGMTVQHVCLLFFQGGNTEKQELEDPTVRNSSLQTSGQVSYTAKSSLTASSSSSLSLLTLLSIWLVSLTVDITVYINVPIVCLAYVPPFP